MSQLLLWLLVLLAALDITTRAENSSRKLQALLELRRQILAEPEAARLQFCEKLEAEGPRLSWREQGSWTSACSHANQSRGLPRYWRLEARLKYGMLFLFELPIRVSIVILA